MGSDAVRSPTRLDVGDDFAFEPGEVSVDSEYDENENKDLDDRDDQVRVLGQEIAHDLASASGKDCIMVQKRPSVPLVNNVSLAERIS